MNAFCSVTAQAVTVRSPTRKHFHGFFPYSKKRSYRDLSQGVESFLVWPVVEALGRESGHMPKAMEFRVTIEDKPGALGKCFLALAERAVNILAFQSYVEERESLVRFIADNPATAKAVLGGLRMNFEETEVAAVRLPHRPGELGRAAARLGEGQINIDYSYCGSEPGSTRGLLVFGVDNVTKAVALLDELAAEDA